MLVKEMDAAVDSLLDGAYWTLGGDELLQFGRALETFSRRVWAAQVRVVDELQRQGVAAARSVSSTSVLAREAFGISPAEAGARVAAAQATLPQRSPSGAGLAPTRPVIGAAVADGLLGAEHVRIALGTLRRLPDQLPSEVWARGRADPGGQRGDHRPAVLPEGSALPRRCPPPRRCPTRRGRSLEGWSSASVPAASQRV